MNKLKSLLFIKVDFEITYLSKNCMGFPDTLPCFKIAFLILFLDNMISYF